MRKTIISLAVLSACATPVVSAASLEDIRISGFGTIAVGVSDNDSGYMDFNTDVDTNNDSRIGLQLDSKINDRMSFSAQLVARGKYDYEPKFESGFVRYEGDWITVRGGVFKAPLLMYADYIDIGYSYPMLRASDEAYGVLDITTIAGIDLLIPIDIGSTTLQLQPFYGNGQIDAYESAAGAIDMKDIQGLGLTWYIDNWTLNASYAMGTLFPVNVENEFAQMTDINDKDTSFTSLGMQYNDGNWIATIEAVRHYVEGTYWDSRGGSALIGRRMGTVTPYVMVGYTETTDDDKRAAFEPLAIERFERLSYSLGARWDFMANVALKADVTYVDYRDTFGGYMDNAPFSTGLPAEEDAYIYAVAIDFVF